MARHSTILVTSYGSGVASPPSPHLPNRQDDEVNVWEVGGEAEVEAAPLGDRGLVEVGEGQLVAEVAHQLGPAAGRRSDAPLVIREREGAEVLIGPLRAEEIPPDHHLFPVAKSSSSLLL